MASIGSLTVNLDMRTSKFEAGAKKARAELADLDKMARFTAKVSIFAGAIFGLKKFADQLSMASQEVQKVGTATGHFSKELVDAATKANTAWERLGTTIRMTAQAAAVKPFSWTAWLAEQASYGITKTTSAEVDEAALRLRLTDPKRYMRFREAFSDDPLKALEDFYGLKRSRIGFINESYVTRYREALKQTGIMQSPIDTQSWVARQFGSGMGMKAIESAIARWVRPPSEMSLSEVHRIQTQIGGFLASQQGAPGAVPQRLRDMTVRGLSALEKGTAEAFSQERRSAQQNQLMQIQKDTLKENKEQTKALHQIDGHLRNTMILEAANFAA